MSVILYIYGGFILIHLPQITVRYLSEQYQIIEATRALFLLTLFTFVVTLAVWYYKWL